MHVGLFIDAFYPPVDGVVNVVEAYAQRLSAKCSITVFAPYARDLAPDFDERFPFRVVRCKSIMKKTHTYPQAMPWIDKEYRDAMAASKLDLVHIHSAYPIGLFGKRLAKKMGIPLVGTLHSDFRPDVYELMGRLAGEAMVKFLMKEYNSCHECWVASEGVGRKFVEEYGLKSPVRVVPLSTDHLPVADVAAAREEINALYGLEDDVFVMAHVGRQDLQKREDFILQSLKLLKDKGKRFKMLFVGDGSKHGYLKSLCSSLGLDDEVFFCGAVNDKGRLMKMYSRTDLLLFPSISDTFGLVKVEAACQKTPTLFVKGTLASEGVRNNVDGFTCYEGHEAFASRIAKLMDNPALLATVGEGAFRSLYHTWDQVVDEVFDNYCRLLGK